MPNQFPNTYKAILIVKYNFGLKTLLQQGISEPIFYGDLVYKFKRIVEKPNFSDQFKKIVKRYIRVGYNLQSRFIAMVSSLIARRSQNSMTALTLSFNRWVGA